MRLLFSRLLPTPFLATALASQPVETQINYADHVAPILAQHCAACHHPAGIGPFSLLTFHDAQRRSRQIAEVTASRFMPPWKPNRSHGPSLVGERFLTDAEIERLAVWHEQGAVSGDLSSAPEIPPPESAWTLGPPDLVIQLPEAYTLPAAGRDVYRNFAIPLNLTATRYVRALQLRPGARSPIHHALVLLDNSGRARARDQSERGPGYDGMGIGSGTPPAGHIVGWTPGQAPYEAFPGTAWPITPATDLVLQLHLLPTGRPETIAPEIGLYFTDTPPERESFVFQLRNFDIEIPAGESAYTIEESITLPTPVRVLSLYPHAHYLGKDLQLFATLPSGEKQWLLHIPDWDFNWQGDYRLKSPLALPAATTLHMRYTFDNSPANPFNPSDPPVAVRGGWSSTDEMAEAMIQVLPDTPADLPRLVAAQNDYDIAKAGGEARFHYFNGIYLEQQGEYAQALTAYHAALELDPTFASVYYKLGVIAEAQGDRTRAVSRYRDALAYQPAMISARLGLAKLLVQQRQFEEAGQIIRAVYAENPTHLLACLYLARFQLAQGDGYAALTTFAAGETHFAQSPQFHLEYGETLWQAHRLVEARRHLELAANLEPENLAVGATETLQATRASAHYALALIHRESAETAAAQTALNRCLEQAPYHLDALLLAADLALQNQDLTAAQDRLSTLVSLPANETFSDEDILAHLPQPAGTIALAEGYVQQGKLTVARRVFDLSIAHFVARGQSAAAEQLRQRRNTLLPP